MSDNMIPELTLDPAAAAAPVPELTLEPAATPAAPEPEKPEVKPVELDDNDLHGRIQAHRELLTEAG